MDDDLKPSAFALDRGGYRPLHVTEWLAIMRARHGLLDEAVEIPTDIPANARPIVGHPGFWVTVDGQFWREAMTKVSAKGKVKEVPATRLSKIGRDYAYIALSENQWRNWRTIFDAHFPRR